MIKKLGHIVVLCTVVGLITEPMTKKKQNSFLAKWDLNSHHYTVMRFLDLKETSTDMAADWIFEKFKLI